MTCSKDCNGHGTCMADKCSCDLGFFSSNSSRSDCRYSGVHKWGKGWEFFMIFFGICFGIIFLCSFLKLRRSLKQEKTYDCKNKCKRLFLSPKNLSLLGIIIISLIKVIWLSFDPLVFKNKSNRLVDRLLFETIYPIMFTVLASVLLVWSGMYQGLRNNKRNLFRILSKFIVGLMILVYPLSWMLSINKGLRAEQEFWYWLGYVSLAIGSSLLSSLFIGFFALLYCHISRVKSEEIDKKQESDEKIAKSMNDIIEKNHEVSEIKENRESFKHNSLKTDFFESIKRKSEKNEWNELESLEMMNQSRHIEDLEDLKIQEIKETDKKQNYLDKLTEDDKKLFKKLLLMTCISGISGLLIIAIGTPFTLSNSLEKPILTFIGIFFAFFLEMCICILIMQAFTTQINKPEKKNIKQLVYLARKNRSKSPSIELPKDYQNISRRLRLYYV